VSLLAPMAPSPAATIVIFLVWAKGALTSPATFGNTYKKIRSFMHLKHKTIQKRGTAEPHQIVRLWLLHFPLAFTLQKLKNVYVLTRLQQVQ
jgi:hypothetical protein